MSWAGYSVQVQVDFGRVLDRGPWLWKRPSGPRHSRGSGYKAPRTRGQVQAAPSSLRRTRNAGKRPWPSGAPGGVRRGLAGLPVGLVPAAVRAAVMCHRWGRWARRHGPQPSTLGTVWALARLRVSVVPAQARAWGERWCVTTFVR